MTPLPCGRKILGDLLPELTGPAADLSVPGLVIDSRQVRPGDLFLAFPGDSLDGRQFMPQAVTSGAGAIVAERGIGPNTWPVTVVEVDGLRARVSDMADRFFDCPSADLSVIGVTGTNGKTSCTQLLGQALRLSGHPCGVIGTLGASLDGTTGGGSLTTPDPIGLQAQLAEWRDKQVPFVAMEASSHGLAQGRVSAVRFQGAVFTNLSRDHLDFHGDMASYGAAKAKLFADPGLGFAVINDDDSFGRELAQRLRTGATRVVTFGRGDSADVRAVAVTYRADGIDVAISCGDTAFETRAQLLGDFNLSNLLAVVAVLRELGLSTDRIATLVPVLKPIAGRMERVPGDANIEVVVDYAHTPDALEQALRALRRHCRGQLWCVFGCGGDRDPGKRPLMGAVAERLADRVVLTNDNPRSENPQTILNAIAEGMQAPPTIQSDRSAAIREAISQAAPGDLVLLAGKGHEDYQLVDGQRRPFSDVATARAALISRRQGAAAR